MRNESTNLECQGSDTSDGNAGTSIHGPGGEKGELDLPTQRTGTGGVELRSGQDDEIACSNELVEGKRKTGADVVERVGREKKIIVDNRIRTVVPIIRLRNRLRIGAQPFVQDQ
jgi:hypothetical protein